MWNDIAPVLPWICTVTAVGYAIYVTIKLSKKKGNTINPDFEKDCPKVVHSFDIEDLGTKVVFCRCWRSGKFPYCDGTHGKHNKETGDNIGPLVLKSKDV